MDSLDSLQYRRSKSILVASSPYPPESDESFVPCTPDLMKTDGAAWASVFCDENEFDAWLISTSLKSEFHAPECLPPDLNENCFGLRFLGLHAPVVHRLLRYPPPFAPRQCPKLLPGAKLLTSEENPEIQQCIRRALLDLFPLASDPVQEMSKNATAQSAVNTTEDALKFTTMSSQDKECTSLAAGGLHKSFDFLGVLCESAVAGAAAGAVVEAALYPIDTIKTRLQAVRGGGEIILKGLYSGLAGNLAGVIPASALFIGVYEPTKQKLLDIFPEKFSAIAHLAAGAIGGAASSIVRVPTEVIKQRIQMGQFVSAPEAVRLVVSNEGFKGLYAGYGSFLLRDLPFDAIQFCIYEQLQIGYKLAAKRDLKDSENAIIGAFAGAITGAMTTPLDVIKTRLMIQGSTKQYNGILHCVNTIIKEEGSSAFFRGMGPRVLWIGIGGSIFFGVLEKTKQLLAQRRPLEENRKELKLT